MRLKKEICGDFLIHGSIVSTWSSEVYVGKLLLSLENKFLKYYFMPSSIASEIKSWEQMSILRKLLGK